LRLTPASFTFFETKITQRYARSFCVLLLEEIFMQNTIDSYGLHESNEVDKPHFNFFPGPYNLNNLNLFIHSSSLQYQHTLLTRNGVEIHQSKYYKLVQTTSLELIMQYIILLHLLTTCILIPETKHVNRMFKPFFCISS
jgi:hypothetical protein